MAEGLLWQGLPEHVSGKRTWLWWLYPCTFSIFHSWQCFIDPDINLYLYTYLFIMCIIKFKSYLVLALLLWFLFVYKLFDVCVNRALMDVMNCVSWTFLLMTFVYFQQWSDALYHLNITYTNLNNSVIYDSAVGCLTFRYILFWSSIPMSHWPAYALCLSWPVLCLHIAEKVLWGNLINLIFSWYFSCGWSPSSYEVHQASSIMNYYLMMFSLIFQVHLL